MTVTGYKVKYSAGGPRLLGHKSEHGVRPCVHDIFSSSGGGGSPALCAMLSSCFKMASDRAKWSNNVHIQLHTRAGLFKAWLRKPGVSAKFKFRFESLKSKFSLILSLSKLMIGCS